MAEYDRELIARMLEDYDAPGPAMAFTRDAVMTQVQLLRAADNAEAQAQTGRAEPQGLDYVQLTDDGGFRVDPAITDSPGMRRQFAAARELRDQARNETTEETAARMKETQGLDAAVGVVWNEVLTEGDRITRRKLRAALLAALPHLRGLGVPDGMVLVPRTVLESIRDSSTDDSARGFAAGALAAAPKSAAVEDVPTGAADWRIDTSAGRPILVYKNCSVIEDETARYVLGLIERDSKPAEDETSDPPTAEVVESVLLLVDDTNAPAELIETWTDEQRIAAYDWAMALHFHASDNDDVVVPPRPDFIPHEATPAESEEKTRG